MADNSDLLNQLVQWAKLGGVQAPNNVAQGSSPEITADAAQSLVGGPSQNQGVFSGGDTGGQGSTGSWTPTINPVTGLHDDQAKALKAVLAAQDKQHAQEAVAAQGPEAMRQLLDLHTATSPSQESTTATGQVDPIKQQAMNLVAPATTVLGKLLESAGFGTQTKAKQLANLSNAQKILGQVPLQQEDIEKSALETSQKINQALTVPPTQSEKLQNAAAYAGYKTTALKDMLDNNNTATTQQNEILKNMQGYSSWFNKPFGAMPKEAQSAVKKLQQLQLERIAVASELNKHQSLLASGGISTSPFKEGQIYTDAQGNTATFKNGKFQ